MSARALLKALWASDKPWLSAEANEKLRREREEIMAKQADSGSANGFDETDLKITMLKDRLLPYVRTSSPPSTPCS